MHFSPLSGRRLGAKCTIVKDGTSLRHGEMTSKLSASRSRLPRNESVAKNKQRMAAHQILLLATQPSRCSFHGNRISGGFWQPARCAPTKNDKSTMLIPSHIHRDAFHSRLWPHLCEFPVSLCAKISRQRIKIAAVCTTKKKKMLRVGWKIKRECRFLEDTFWLFWGPKRLIMFLQFSPRKTMELLPVVRRRAHMSSGTMWSHNACDSRNPQTEWPPSSSAFCKGKESVKTALRTLLTVAKSRNCAAS